MKIRLPGLSLALAGMLDIVYPSRCLICERYGEPIVCDACHDAFSAVPLPVCSRCGRPVNFSTPCHTCEEADLVWGGWAFTLARSAGLYEGALRHALHRLKYRHIELLGPALGAWMANRIVAEGLIDPGDLKRVDAVIPVPTLRARERQRGFSHTAHLAAPVAEQMGVPFLPRAVTRLPRPPGQAAARPQVGLTGMERRQNLSAAHFVVPDPAGIAGKSILLIDDVFTTGATVNACVSVLRQAGASCVLVVTLATGG